jgi:EAL domain-containing protein (putative c-di-GMP-specific phosphodiesterase class I)
VISLAHELAMKVTAEGIETSEQLRIVRDAGADFLQGFLVREPVPAETVLALLEAGPTKPESPSAGPTAESPAAGAGV